MGGREGSKSKPDAVNGIPTAGEPSDSNHILRQGKRPRGRPKGSKNKPETETVPAPQVSSAATVVIEIPAGANLVQSLSDFSCRHQVLVIVLNASGDLSDIVSNSQPNVSIPGPCPILSLSCTVAPTPPQPSGSGAISSLEIPLVVSLSLPDEIRFHGIAARSATAASMVKVVAMTTELKNVTFATNDDDGSNPPPPQSSSVQ